MPEVIAPPAGMRIWLAAGVTDMRCGFQGLAAKVQTALEENPLGGHVFIFRGRRGDLVKLLWATDDGLWLLAKRLERGRFIWPQADGGKIHLTSAQLSMLLEGIDWRQPRARVRTRPSRAAYRPGTPRSGRKKRCHSPVSSQRGGLD
ncbi:IS66 family insertion sequence element accessory protein TnpB [Caballeronia sp. 15715]|uniref:IS66 family insertion sequence element accessory protein TnpB n=1 Tax=Caballeronia sp. 15715 TaxID=3391030 RepID=UPI0039E44354